MTRANNNADSKRTYEASAFTVPSVHLRPAQRHSSGETGEPAEQGADLNSATQQPRSPDLKPAIIMRLIQIVKDL